MGMWNSGRYRLYAMDRSGRVVGQQPFAAPSEAHAREVGHAVLKACNDECTAIEIRKGYRRIARFETDDGGRLDFFPTEGPIGALAFEVAAALASSDSTLSKSRRLATILARRRA